MSHKTGLVPSHRQQRDKVFTYSVSGKYTQCFTCSTDDHVTVLWIYYHLKILQNLVDDGHLG